MPDLRGTARLEHPSRLSGSKPRGTSQVSAVSARVGLSHLHRDHSSRQSAPGIGMKFCHGDKHCNLQHSPQICLPPSLASVITLTDALPLLFDVGTHLLDPHNPSTCEDLFSFQSQKVFFLCVFHGAYAPLLPPRAGPLFQHLCFHPTFSSTQDLSMSQLSPQLLDPFVFLLQHFLWEAGSNILC